MIVVTGAAGFIGSYLVSFLNKQDRENIIVVDDFSFPEKNKNLNEFFNIYTGFVIVLMLISVAFMLSMLFQKK